jgi:nucleotide-binding universal stress UspA family protein
MANDVALKFSAEIILVNVVSTVPVLGAAAEPVPVAFDVGAYQERIRREAKENLQRVSQTYISEELNFETMVATGAAADNIVMLADDLKVDMIVMATHGHTGWRRLILGSVTEIVIRNSRCYVLTVPAPTDENQQ